MKYVSVEQMIAIEKESDAKGHTYPKMMEQAGHGLAEAMLDVYGYLEAPGALALVGSGNNGGDALVALAHLAEEDWRVSAYIVRPREADDPLVTRLVDAGGQVYSLEDDTKYEQLKALLRKYPVLMDGILGTGIRLPIRGKLAEVMGFVRQTLADMDERPYVVAVDCPSGIDCDSGEAAPECTPADLTVTMAAIKQGLFKFPAYKLVGELRLTGIGLPNEGEDLKAWREVKSFVPDINWVADVMPSRPLDAHKGTFGTALVVAGSVNYTGAALLAGEAAYRIGTGLVTLGVPTPLHTALSGHFSEATWLLLPHELGVISVNAAEIVHKNLDRATALLIGPGFGMEDTTGEFIADLLSPADKPASAKIGFMPASKPGKQETAKDLPPMVVDADGLKLLTRIKEWPKRLPGETVLTPHPGEMAVLTGLTTAEIQDDRLEIALKYSREWGHIVVLKGAFTVIAAPDGSAAIIPIASPALARAGSGDVLAGLITGLRAQGVPPYQAAVAGAWIHAHAGLFAAQKLGNDASVLAGDILESAIDVIGEVYAE